MSFPWSFIFRSSSSSTSSPRSKALLVPASNSCFLFKKKKKIKEENGIILETDLYKSPSRTYLGWFDKWSNHFPVCRRQFLLIQVTFSFYYVLICLGENWSWLLRSLSHPNSQEPRRQAVYLVAQKSKRKRVLSACESSALRGLQYERKERLV